jgi:large subunit ribosomal protein L11
MQVKLLADGGNMKPGPALSQKLGPAGIPVNQVIQKVNEATKNFQGMKVPVELDIDTGTKNITVTVFSPPVSELLKKEMNVEKGSGDQKNLQIANASIEQIISVAKTKMPNLLCNDLKSAVKTVLGSCVSLGMLVENKPAVEIISEIDEGKYDKEIKNENTETSEDKKIKLKKYFDEVKINQEKLIKAKQAETEKKAEAKPEEKPEAGKK